MKKSVALPFVLIMTLWFTGCASVPMAPPAEDEAKKTFAPPTDGMAGIYLFRDSSFGGALLKSVYIDGKFLGETGPNVYFYTEVDPGQHTFSTESEFSENHLKLTTEANKLYFIRQYIKFGVFVGGANFEVVPPDEGKAAVKECTLALTGQSQTEGQPDKISVPE